MAMAASEIEALIKAALPDARVTIEDLAGDGDHYAATVVSEHFRGITRLKQHQIVYPAARTLPARAMCLIRVEDPPEVRLPRGIDVVPYPSPRSPTHMTNPIAERIKG